MDKKNYSVVVPVYKSVFTLEPLYVGIAELMQDLGASFEVIFVDDNGSEESWKKLLELKKQYSDAIILIKLTKNFGQNGATLCGIDAAKGDVVITIDDDLQVKPEELRKLIDCYIKDKPDVIYGVYKESTKGTVKNLGSKVIKSIFSKAEHGSNIGSSIRLINRNITTHLQNHLQDHLFINQVISWYTYDCKFIEVEHSPRSEGKSGYGFFQLLRIAFRLLFLYTSIPLKIMIVICVLSSIGSLMLAGFYIYKHFALGQGLGFLSLIVTAISLILVSISIMGIYLNRIYDSRTKKPHYAIKMKL